MHLTLGIAVYTLILIFTIVRILLDTDSTAKTLAYLLLVLILPVAGVIFYFSFGINYRHRQSTSLGEKAQVNLDADYQKNLADPTEALLRDEAEELGHYGELVRFLHNIGGEYLSRNEFTLLVNGEKKFPEVLKTLAAARHSIHMEYYAWENDVRGNQIKDVLLKKAAEGVKVRLLYDDYASRGIKRNIVRELQAGGVNIFPKIRIKVYQLANRINHRDHRKVIIVDGHTGFIGGINLSDRYDNSIDTGLYWRDTHMKVTGPLAWSLQRHFMVSWNVSQPNPLEFRQELYPAIIPNAGTGVAGLGQVIAGGPIYPLSNIMLSYLRIFTLAREKLYITNPYFIPSESILDALKQAALSGVDVRLLLPKKSDSAIVGAASRFYFQNLLNAGVRIFLYKKGFVHAKTVVADTRLSVVGTANMDIRSFDLNFEIMSVVYGREFSRDMEQMFLDDLRQCEEVNREDWADLGLFRRLTYAVARLISAFL